VDWWSKQSNTSDSTEATLDLIEKWKIPMWFNEGGVIDKAMGPLINLRMRQRRVYCDRRSITSMSDKVAKCSSFQGRAAAGTVHFRDNANSHRVVQQLVDMPQGRFDDAADVCGLIGRAVDQFQVGRVPVSSQRERLEPFSVAWLEHEEREKPKLRWR
jgi:hypothetical protein